MTPELVDLIPLLASMVVLIGCSAFFSASEAALFYLRPRDRRRLATGSSAQRMAASLLSDPDRLLTAVLFWNLVVNIGYFALASIVGLQLEQRAGYGRSASVMFGLGALLTIIFCSEMLPKSFAVLRAQWLSATVSFPLAIAVRAVDPLMPLLRLIYLGSRRLIWPSFQPEAHLEIADLERAIELSTTDAELVEQERAVLTNIVAMSEIRADEWMRPRTQFRPFRPPVSLSDLRGTMTPSGYLLVTEQDGEEIEGALNLRRVSELPQEHLEYHVEPVFYVPWCTTVADVWERMQHRDREVAAVVNEFGETIGILTAEDLLDTMFTYSPSRSKRLLDRNPIHDIGPGRWLVAGVTSLRRLARYLNTELPSSKSVTIGGVVQEMLQKLADVGDQCEWGPFQIRVLEAPQRGHMLLELTRIDGEAVSK